MHPANSIALFRTNRLDRAAARQLQRRKLAGELVRVRHGVYVERSGWDALDGRSRHLVRMRAALPLLRRGAVWSLDSAAAILGAPRLDPWPERVHAILPGLEHDLRRAGLTMHAGSPVVSERRFHGVEFTSLAQTTIELARRGSLSAAVVWLDHALRSGVRHEDLECLAIAAGPWGAVRLEHALEICDARRESVGESYFAARAAELGCPDMEPQHEFVGVDGAVDRVDFWLPRQGIVIEFDGRQKYEDPAMLHGRSGAEAVWVEKQREDRIRSRREVNGFVRVHWAHCADPERLREHLRQHGVPCR
ncbi:hypothetical protein EDF64_102212 [Curtobacterium flaccumfaciens]|uniref:Uncharacterized protein n=1 Tax=Curtobacterium flaccumfaciens TaxID=2035 RepID=A0A4R6DN78_9MICO|nr:hypothetical protein [Curtobacterium flaccumfaciens]TDN45799.1 hypothetical protein EDF64_102212 [Curtobacterium flaccumfaciens]